MEINLALATLATEPGNDNMVPNTGIQMSLTIAMYM